MKGTAPRGRMDQEEKSSRLELHHDKKNRSENVIIVDLLRNGLAHLMHGHGQSEAFVDSLFDVESYESLLQITSNILMDHRIVLFRTNLYWRDDKVVLFAQFSNDGYKDRG